MQPPTQKDLQNGDGLLLLCLSVRVLRAQSRVEAENSGHIWWLALVVCGFVSF